MTSTFARYVSPSDPYVRTLRNLARSDEKSRHGLVSRVGGHRKNAQTKVCTPLPCSEGIAVRAEILRQSSETLAHQIPAVIPTKVILRVATPTDSTRITTQVLSAYAAAHSTLNRGHPCLLNISCRVALL